MLSRLKTSATLPAPFATSGRRAGRSAISSTGRAAEGTFSGVEGRDRGRHAATVAPSAAPDASPPFPYAMGLPDRRRAERAGRPRRGPEDLSLPCLSPGLARRQRPMRGPDRSSTSSGLGANSVRSRVDAVDTTSVMVMVATAAVAGLPVMAISPELVLAGSGGRASLLGIAIGPQGLESPRSTRPPTSSATSGSACLLLRRLRDDFQRIEGRPLKLATMAWALSLALAYGLGGALAAAGVVLSYLYTGSAMVTTAIGTLIPIRQGRGRAQDPVRDLPAGGGRDRASSARSCRSR